MHRFYAEGSVVDGVAMLSGEDSRHAVRVLRMSEGEALELIADGKRYLAAVESIGEDGVRVRVDHELRSTEAATRLTVYQGLPKADKMELIAQKATELGVHAVQPVAMERSVVRLDGKDAQKKAERWQKIAREAVKQCARVCAPEIRVPKKLSELEGEFAELDVLIVPWEDARDGSVADCLAPLSGKPDAKIGMLIGPEGGISPKEAEWLAAHGAKLVTLGPRILRTETAAVCTAAVIMALRGEMQ